MHNFETADGRGMAFDGHSDHGVYCTKGGSIISRADWPRFRGALDEMPDLSDVHERADAEAKAEAKIKGFVNDVEELLQKCDRRWAVKFHEMLDKHHLSSRARREDSDPDAVLGKAKGATDKGDDMHDEPSDPNVRFSNLATHLLSEGLGEDDVREALKRAGCPKGDRKRIVADCLARQGEDRIPLPGTKGGAGGHIRGKYKGQDDDDNEWFNTERLSSDGYGFDAVFGGVREERAYGTNAGSSEDFYQLFGGARRLARRGL